MSKDKLKVVCISDTHNMHDQLELPSGDILVHAGDATGRGRIEELEEYNRWLGSIKHKYKYIIIIAGNHDWLFAKDQTKARAIMSNAIYLEDELIEIEGRRIYGSPHQPEFCNWAFNVPRGAPLKAIWDKIPHNLDLLITHGPPHGLCDTLRKMVIADDEKGRPTYQEHMVHLGCEDLYNAVMEKQPKVHVFGHIHDGYGTLQVGSSLFVNASSCTEQYRPINPPIIVYI